MLLNLTPEQPDEEVRRELADGESVLWSGRPALGVRFRGTDLFIFPFSLLWAGFAVFWEVEVVRSGAPWFFKAWGVPFVAVGLYMIIGRFFIDAIQRSRTSYCITDRRALIVSWFLTRRVRSINLNAVSEVGLLHHRNGLGSIVFGSRMRATRGAPESPRFDWIQHAGEVYQLVTSIQSGMTSGAA